MTSPNRQHAERYLAAIEAGATGEDLARFFDPEIVQEEFPNRLVPDGARRDLAAILDGAERGMVVVPKQRYVIRNSVEQGETLVLEVDWFGTLAVPVGSLNAGDEMHARFAVFLVYRDGRIQRQRNYDCFDAF